MKITFLSNGEHVIEGIEDLQGESATLALELADTLIALETVQSEQAELLLALIQGGVL